MTPLLVAMLFLPCDSWKTTEPALNMTIVNACPHTVIMSWRDDVNGSMEYSRWINSQSFSVGDPLPVMVAAEAPSAKAVKRKRHKKRRRR